MRESIIDIYHVCINEFKVVFRDPAVILLFFIVPLSYPLLYSLIYNNEVVHEAKLVVVDGSHSSLSREFIRKVDATGDVKVVGVAADMEEAQEAMRRKEVYGILYIPSDFSKNINTVQQTQVMVYSDMSSLLFYKSFLLSATEVSLDMGANIRVAEMGYSTQNQDESTMQAIDYEWVPFYNTQNGFASFLVPAILILVLQQTLVLGIGTIVGTHNDKKRFAMASFSNVNRNIRSVNLTIGKAMCYSTLYLVISVWVLRVVPYLFRFPQIGDPLTILAFLIPYLLAATFFAMTISYFSSQREFIMLLFVFTSIPFLFISGISWPWTAIPEPLKAIGYMIPSTPAIHAFVKVNTMGATLADIKTEFITLWIHAVIYCVFATLMYKWWISNYDPAYTRLKKNQPADL
ncbi:ABC transporter permease [Dysgonomonas sp. 216]|uniref:ABC transporter permease n=1 Tax=Dysgonomonas sp. 216 TaxID=2302934 RepID=UPI0013D1EB1F|nr:ABC transporter permease [Dysgonomonas sp. 216]NDW18169.1 ABC transporter permease [Dysgonomonas sp. 216]